MAYPILYLDEDVNPLLASILNQRGFSAKTTKECRMLGSTDEEQLKFATNGQYVFLTHNIADFCRLNKIYAEQKKEHFGIVLAPQWELPKFLRASLAFLQEASQKNLKNQLIWLHSYSG